MFKYFLIKENIYDLTKFVFDKTYSSPQEALDDAKKIVRKDTIIYVVEAVNQCYGSAIKVIKNSPTTR